MKLSSLPRKLKRGLPYLKKEIRAIVSDRTPFFIAVPRTVHIWRDGPCNAKCIMCSYGFLPAEVLGKLWKSPFTDNLMPRVLNEIHELCGRGTLVSYMGGEPTTSRHLVDWIEQAGQLGLDFRFTTNGYIMDEEMARRLVTAGLFNIGISLESLDPGINETIRPFPDGTAKTLRCITLLLQERKRQNKHVSLNIKTVLTDINLESFLEIVKRFGKMDGVMCTPQIFEPLDGMPEATRNLLSVKDNHRLRQVTDQIRGLKREGYAIHVTDQALDDMVKQNQEDQRHAFTMSNKQLEMDSSQPACNIATDNLWIQDGAVKLCPYFPPVGNMVSDAKTTVKELWQSETARKTREQTRACRRLCTISCLRRTPLAHKVSTFLKIA
ncbi:MAG TPA: radical SAM protein [Verrucomicrobiae bacterium]|nr:radical SAM protein [Verrucomicrobiae bacterium]